MEDYLLLRQVHIACVILSLTGFALRGVWMLRGSPLLSYRLTGILPHIIDTLLLGSAIGLVWTAHLNPLSHAWLTAKLTALLVYIVLGSIALRRGRTRMIRSAAFAGALLTAAYLVGVAVTRNPWPLA